MNKTRKLVVTALFAALICVLTMFPKFPLAAGGYIHLGDALIILAVYFIGAYSVPAAAAGSALADIISGYFIYSPATFIIKGLMALDAYCIYKVKGSDIMFVISALVCETVMALGYFLYEIFLYGSAVALTNLPFSLIQAAGGIITGLAFYFVSKKAKLKEILIKF